MRQITAVLCGRCEPEKGAQPEQCGEGTIGSYLLLMGRSEVKVERVKPVGMQRVTREQT